MLWQKQIIAIITTTRLMCFVLSCGGRAAASARTR
jgi:hypothetical protein